MGAKIPTVENGMGESPSAMPNMAEVMIGQPRRNSVPSDTTLKTVSPPR